MSARSDRSRQSRGRRRPRADHYFQRDPRTGGTAGRATRKRTSRNDGPAKPRDERVGAPTRTARNDGSATPRDERVGAPTRTARNDGRATPRNKRVGAPTRTARNDGRA